jgi:streptogramin lyase
MPARRLLGATLAALLATSLLALGSSPASADTGDITSFTNDDLGSVWGVTAGPDGNLWFTDYEADVIGRITPAGVITTFKNPAQDLQGALGITAGPDGNVWFTDEEADLIGRITPVGTITTFEDPQEKVEGPLDITTGPDGNLWFTNGTNDAPSIGRITPTGTITTFDHPDLENPVGIAAGPDGNVWFTDTSGLIGRITPAGTITTFDDPQVGEPTDVVAGPDGNLWFTSFGDDRIGRITPAGTITTFTDPGGDLFHPETITAAADGNLWFTNRGSNDIGRITTSGAITIFPASAGATGVIAAGPDDEVWFADQAGTVNRVQVCGGGVFTDVGITHPFRADICWMGAEGISEGYEPGPSYRPSAAVTRQAMSAFMYRLAGEPAFTSPASPTFSDVGAAHTFYDEIEWMADEGISTGYPASPKPTYRPGDPVTRQAMSAFLYRLAGEPPVTPPGTATFTDVSASHPFAEEIEWMAEEGISEGYQPGPTYRPANVVTRQAMSAFMQRMDDVWV